MVDSVNKLDLSYQKYQTNGAVIDDNYKGKLLFPMKYFLSFVAYFQSIYFVSTILLKGNIDGILAPRFQLAYIHN